MDQVVHPRDILRVCFVDTVFLQREHPYFIHFSNGSCVKGVLTTRRYRLSWGFQTF